MSRIRKPAAKPSVRHADSITPQGRAMNSGQAARQAEGARPAPHQPGQAKQQAKQQARQQAGHQTGHQAGMSHDSDRTGGFGMADPSDRPAARAKPKGATPAPVHQFADDREHTGGAHRHTGVQPGAHADETDDIHPEREGYAQPESQKGLLGDGHDERGDYGRGPPPGAHQGENAKKK